MNITSLVKPNTMFICDCGWKGVATELASFNGFSCCPDCQFLDVRIDFEEMVNQG